MAAADPVRLIRAGERSRDAAQTPGMTREQAIASGRLWAGIARTSPRMISGWHHHADYETAIYVLSGRVRLESGPGGALVVEAGPGDFLQVPPGAVHRESNPDDTESVIVVVRAGSGPAVVNVDGPAAR